MQKVMITGASGFIGGNLARYYIGKKYEVVGIDRERQDDLFRIEAIDMSDHEMLSDFLEEQRPDIIIHCAGCADVANSVKNPHTDFVGNVVLTHNLLFAMHNLGLSDTRLVFLSSAAVYGNPQSLPIAEDAPLRPLSPYAEHKMICEELCEYFIDNYGMNIKIARVFSAYGIGLKKQIFWDLCQRYITTGEMSVLGTGNESRDYIHISDLVQAIYLLSITESKESIFNVANGEEISIRNAVEILSKEMGTDKSKISFSGVVREGDPINWCADIERIKTIGYRKTVDIIDGLKEYIKWVNES